MKANKDISVKFRTEALLTSKVWYVDIVQVSVATNGRCFVKQQQFPMNDNEIDNN